MTVLRSVQIAFRFGLGIVPAVLLLAGCATNSKASLPVVHDVVERLRSQGERGLSDDSTLSGFEPRCDSAFRTSSR
jgi:hypothetical protein